MERNTQSHLYLLYSRHPTYSDTHKTDLYKFNRFLIKISFIQSYIYISYAKIYIFIYLWKNNVFFKSIKRYFDKCLDYIYADNCNDFIIKTKNI